MTARTSPVSVDPKIVIKCLGSTSLRRPEYAKSGTPSAAAATGRAPREKAAAKAIRCIVASGLSHASAVFLYPSGVAQP